MEEMSSLYPILEVTVDPSNQNRHTSVIIMMPNLCTDCMRVYWIYPQCDLCGETCCPFENCVRYWTSHRCFPNCICNLCNKAFVSEEHKQQHYATHAIAAKVPYTETNDSKNKVEIKMPQNHDCVYCGKIFLTEYDLEVHWNFHSDKKPFICSYCSKRFGKKSHLTDHMRIHTGEKPYICKYCSISFTAISTLIRHRRIHTGEQPYKCNYCGKSFSQVVSLHLHKRTHTGEKPYMCNECGYRSAQKRSLIDHKKIRSGKNPVKCQRCGTFFSSKKCRIVHQKKCTSSNFQT